MSNDLSKVTVSVSPPESTTGDKESADNVTKANVPREWRHNVSFPNKFIIGDLCDKMHTRTSLKNKHRSISSLKQNQN